MSSPSSHNQAALAHLSKAQVFTALILMICSVFGVGLGLGILFPYITETLAARGISSTVIGLNHASGAFGIMVIGAFIPALIQRLGVKQSVIIGLVLTALLLLALAQVTHLAGWFVLRFCLGAVLALPWIGTESYMNLMAPEKSRGRWLAFFFMVLCLGMAFGTTLLKHIGAQSALPLYVSAGLIVLSAVPVLWAPALSLEKPESGAKAWGFVFLTAPLAMLGGFYTGLSDTALLGLLTLYAQTQGLENPDAIQTLTYYLVGQAILLPVLGILTDYTRTSTMFRIIGILAAAAAFAVASSFHLPMISAICLFLWGGINGAAYAVGLTELGRNFKPAHLTAANTIFVIFFNIGSVLGPTMAGIGMDMAAFWGLPIVIAVPALMLALLTFFKSRHHQAQSGL